MSGSPSFWNSFTVSCHPSSMIRYFGEQPPSEKLPKLQNNDHMLYEVCNDLGDMNVEFYLSIYSFSTSEDPL